LLKHGSIILVIAITFLSMPTFADEEIKAPEETKKTSIGKDIILPALGIEAMISVMSIWAVESPDTFIASMIVFPPLVGEYKETWPMILAFETMALYNLSIDHDQETENNIFVNNVIGWHVTLSLAAGAMYYIHKNDDLSVAYLPVHDGGYLTMKYSF
jgi:hypothetical protein